VRYGWMPGEVATSAATPARAGSALLRARQTASTAHTTTTAAATASQVRNPRLRRGRSETAVASSFPAGGGVDSSSPSLKNWVSMVLNAEDWRRRAGPTESTARVDGVGESGVLVTARKMASEVVSKQPVCRGFPRDEVQAIRHVSVAHCHIVPQNNDKVVAFPMDTPRFLQTETPYGAVG